MMKIIEIVPSFILSIILLFIWLLNPDVVRLKPSHFENNSNLVVSLDYSSNKNWCNSYGF